MIIYLDYNKVVGSIYELQSGGLFFGNPFINEHYLVRWTKRKRSFLFQQYNVLIKLLTQFTQ